MNSYHYKSSNNVFRLVNKYYRGTGLRTVLRIAAGHLAVTDVNDFEAGDNTRAVADKKNTMPLVRVLIK